MTQSNTLRNFQSLQISGSGIIRDNQKNLKLRPTCVILNVFGSSAPGEALSNEAENTDNFFSSLNSLNLGSCKNSQHIPRKLQKRAHIFPAPLRYFDLAVKRIVLQDMTLVGQSNNIVVKCCDLNQYYRIQFILNSVVQYFR